MSYTAAEGRRTVLADLAEATASLAEALRWLTEAYEHVDEDTGDRLERALFRPVQTAYATAKRTHAQFATRYTIAAPAIDEHPEQQARPSDPRAALDQAGQALAASDETLANLQDSMLPVEVGDRELRAGLSQVRELIAPLPAAASGMIRTLGR